MRFLGWMKRGKNGSAAARLQTAHLCAQGNAIDPEWHSGWSATDTGLTETRRHVGVSAEGFHPGVEEALRVGAGRIAWGQAQPTPEMARKVAGELERQRREAIDETDVRSSPDTTSDRVAVLFDEWRQDSNRARLRDETGQESDAGSVVQNRTKYLGRESS